jgi:hypothetical protein
MYRTIGGLFLLVKGDFEGVLREILHRKTIACDEVGKGR